MSMIIAKLFMGQLIYVTIRLFNPIRNYIKMGIIEYKKTSMFKNRISNGASKQGFITLLSVLIVAAISTMVAVSLLLLGLASSRTSLALEQSKQAQVLADACAEEALQQIRDSTPFAGSANLLLGQGSCDYTVTNTGGQNRTITAIATVGTIVRKLSISLDAINPSINITSWQEVADL